MNAELMSSHGQVLGYEDLVRPAYSSEAGTHVLGLL